MNTLTKAEGRRLKAERVGVHASACPPRSGENEPSKNTLKCELQRLQLITLSLHHSITPSLRLLILVSAFSLVPSALEAANPRLYAPNRLNPMFQAGVPTASGSPTAGQFASAAVNGFSMNLRPLNTFGDSANPGDVVGSMPLFGTAINSDNLVTARLRGGLGGAGYFSAVVQGAATVPVSVLVADEQGNPITTNLVRKTSYGAVQRPFPLRLVIHQDTNSTPLIRLLQRVFVGLRSSGTNQYDAVLSTSEDALDGQNLDSARRISVAHLPWTSSNARWNFSGSLAPGGVLKATVTLNYGAHESNPFLHTYHPDHDNRNAEFGSTPLARGLESYTVIRDITLTITPPGNDFDSLTRGGSQMGGVYEETMTFEGKNTEKKEYDVRGAFVLNRISEIGHLITD